MAEHPYLLNNHYNKLKESLREIEKKIQALEEKKSQIFEEMKQMEKKLDLESKEFKPQTDKQENLIASLVESPHSNFRELNDFYEKTSDLFPDNLRHLLKDKLQKSCEHNQKKERGSSTTQTQAPKRLVLKSNSESEKLEAKNSLQNLINKFFMYLLEEALNRKLPDSKKKRLIKPENLIELSPIVKSIRNHIKELRNVLIDDEKILLFFDCIKKLDGERGRLLQKETGLETIFVKDNKEVIIQKIKIILQKLGIAHDSTIVDKFLECLRKILLIMIDKKLVHFYYNNSYSQNKINNGKMILSEHAFLKYFSDLHQKYNNNLQNNPHRNETLVESRTMRSNMIRSKSRSKSKSESENKSKSKKQEKKLTDQKMGQSPRLKLNITKNTQAIGFWNDALKYPNRIQSEEPETHNMVYLEETYNEETDDEEFFINLGHKNLDITE